MPRDTVVSWKTFALFLLFPPVAIVAVVFFPLTVIVLVWLYSRGKREAMLEEETASSG
jgi:cbb3-type cytochrome oxidase subunit 3